MTAGKTRPRRDFRRPGVAALLLLPLLFAAGGCLKLGEKHYRNHLPHPGVVNCAVPRELQLVSMPPHVAEPGDEFNITVVPSVPRFGHDSGGGGAGESRDDFTVQADGNIDLGFYGDLYVAGLTADEIEEKLRLRLDHVRGTRNDRRPHNVSVHLNRGERYAYVLGAVHEEKRYLLHGNDTVLDLIIDAKLHANSVPEKAYLVRPHPVGGPNQVFKVDWIGIKERGDTLTNYQVFPGDRIVVPGKPEPSGLKAFLGYN